MKERGRPAHPDVLTPAEWRVVEGVRHGLSNPQIAHRCNISVDAVKFHVSNALSKLSFGSRADLRGWKGVRVDSALAAFVESDGSYPKSWSLGQVARLARDVPAMADWFRDTLGLNETMRFDNMAFFVCGDTRIYLSSGDPAANSLLYFRVGNLHAEIARLERSGVTIISAAHRIHSHAGGTEEWMAFVADPEGAALGLMSIVPAHRGDDT
jgi:DNA-binding CsgD family transcriptional regulator/catechol 2,3-dioxygenase-like lactoylglutathione lyase family enzyme